MVSMSFHCPDHEQLFHLNLKGCRGIDHRGAIELTWHLFFVCSSCNYSVNSIEKFHFFQGQRHLTAANTFDGIIDVFAELIQVAPTSNHSFTYRGFTSRDELIIGEMDAYTKTNETNLPSSALMFGNISSTTVLYDTFLQTNKKVFLFSSIQTRPPLNDNHPPPNVPGFV